MELSIEYGDKISISVHNCSEQTIKELSEKYKAELHTLYRVDNTEFHYVEIDIENINMCFFS